MKHKAKYNEDYELLKTRKERVDFTSTDPWRVLRIQGEFVEGFDSLSKLGNSVAIFGSARLGKDTRYWKEAAQVAQMFAQKGLAIITGGARGIGAAVARRLASDGMAVAVLDLDEAACQPVVAEIGAAGGRVSDLDGRPLEVSAGRYLARSRGIVATNGHLHEAVLAACREVLGLG